NAFAKLKVDLDKATGLTEWVVHDIRRTMRTNLSKLVIVDSETKRPRSALSDEVKELMISHAQGGLHEVYDLYEFLDERRVGFERWAERLLEIVAPPPAKPDGSNVVELRRVNAA